MVQDLSKRVAVGSIMVGVGEVKGEAIRILVSHKMMLMSKSRHEE